MAFAPALDGCPQQQEGLFSTLLAPWGILHDYFDGMLATVSLDNRTLDGLAIDHNATDATLATLGILHRDVELGVTEHTLDMILLHGLGDTGVYLDAVVGRLDTENELGNGVPVPGGSTRQP